MRMLLRDWRETEFRDDLGVASGIFFLDFFFFRQ